MRHASPHGVLPFIRRVPRRRHLQQAAAPATKDSGANRVRELEETKRTAFSRDHCRDLVPRADEPARET
jgi:hypothetical protein